LTSVDAVRWLEAEKEGSGPRRTIERRSTDLKRGSFYSDPPVEDGNTYSKKITALGEIDGGLFSAWSRIGLTFAAGLALGVALSSQVGRKGVA
jgi:hypothetical protein